jgi:hypothetical protein
MRFAVFSVFIARISIRFPLGMTEFWAIARGWGAGRRDRGALDHEIGAAAARYQYSYLFQGRLGVGRVDDSGA